jgi:hypothetical protein
MAPRQRPLRFHPARGGPAPALAGVCAFVVDARVQTTAYQSLLTFVTQQAPVMLPGRLQQDRVVRGGG